jgi:hypothetical protein
MINGKDAEAGLSVVACFNVLLQHLPKGMKNLEYLAFGSMIEPRTSEYEVGVQPLYRVRNYVPTHVSLS